jgi:DNA topoisomerase-3
MEKAVIVGKCPICGGNVFENTRNYGCGNWKTKGCKFVIWKEIAGAEITPEIAHELLENGATTETLKFHSRKTGHDFEAGLALDADGQIKFTFPPRKDEDAE